MRARECTVVVLSIVHRPCLHGCAEPSPSLMMDPYRAVRQRSMWWVGGPVRVRQKRQCTPTPLDFPARGQRALVAMAIDACMHATTASHLSECPHVPWTHTYSPTVLALLAGRSPQVPVSHARRDRSVSLPSETTSGWTYGARGDRPTSHGGRQVRLAGYTT